MTDNAPDTSPDTTEAAGDAERLGGVCDSSEKAQADSVDDAVALHIVPSHGPGTIFVAVAEPADLDGSSASSENGGGSPLFKAVAELPPPEAVDLPPEPKTGIEPGHMTAGTPVRLPRESFLPDYDGLAEVATVRVSGLGPAFFFTVGGMVCKPGDKVIVAMEEGQVYGVVVSCMCADPAHLEGAGDGCALRSLLRYATEKDVLTAGNNAALAVEALEYCRGCIRERNLDMKLVDVLVLHDRSKMIFYFTAPARIDFRELVKDLVRRYRTRIELRQIGGRHETQMIGALGNCGMVCCCRRYLRKFASVAIKMAKEQNVFLNPVKISGICGRLLCCLAYEQEHYDEFYRSCPKLGKKYQTDAGVVRVLRASLFRESVTVLTEIGEETEYSLAEWDALHPFRPNASQQQPSGGRKQEGQGDDVRQRRNEGRDRRPGSGSGHEQGLFTGKDSIHDRPRHDARDAARDFEPGAGRDEARPGKCAIPPAEPAAFSARVISEEETVVAEGPVSSVATQSRTVEIVSSREVDSVDPEASGAEDAEEGAGESIFGLAPQQQIPPSGQAPGGAGVRRENAHRPKRPRRRKPRSGLGA